MCKKLLYCLIVMVLFASRSLSQNKMSSCEEIIKQFDTPRITSEAISPDGTFHLIVSEKGSIMLENMKLETIVIISPEVNYDCGSIGCTTPEKRALFTPNGKYAITTSAFIGGPTIIWETTNWTNITSKFNNNKNVRENGLIDGGYFRLSPNGQYLATMRLSWKFGIGLSIIDFDNFTCKIISGMYWTRNIERASGLEFNGEKKWLDKIMNREDYNFCFSNDSRMLIIKKNNKEYIFYNIINHSLSSCSLGGDPVIINQFVSLKEKIVDEIRDLNITEVSRKVKYCCDYSNKSIEIIISYKLIEEFQKAIQLNNKSLVADFINYPIKVNHTNRQITLYDQNDLIKVFDEVFTESFKEEIYQSDFGCLGCEGIMIGSGSIWFDFNGKIICINN